MNIGVTGTRNGMNKFQHSNFVDWIINNKGQDGNFYFHHGDCIGVDAESAKLATSCGYLTVCHPPEKEDLRAFYKSDYTLAPKSYFARNRNIVNSSDVLLVIPYENKHKNVGGTWYTHDYALKMGKKILIFYPNGSIIKVNVDNSLYD